MALPAHADMGVQGQIGIGMRTPETGFGADGLEFWGNVSLGGLGLESGFFYRSGHPDRSGGARIGVGLRPLAALDLDIWEFVDFPMQAAALLGAHEDGFYTGFLTEVGVEFTPTPHSIHAIVGCRIRWAHDTPATAGPTLLLTLALRIAD